MKLIKLMLCLFAVAASSAWAGSQNWTISEFYNGSAPSQKSQTSYFNTVAATHIDTAVYGGIPAGGVAVVVDTTNGQMVSYTSIDIRPGIAPEGTPFGVGDSGNASAGANLYIYQNARSNGPGGYATSYVSASW